MVAFTLADLFASNAVSAAALVAPDESVVAVALAFAGVVTPKIQDVRSQNLGETFYYHSTG